MRFAEDKAHGPFLRLCENGNKRMGRYKMGVRQEGTIVEFMPNGKLY